MGTLTCPNCKEEYSSIGLHWSSAGYPEFSEEEKQILVGLLLGDAYINKMKSGNCRMVLTSKSTKFLTHISEEKIPWLFKEPYIYETSEVSAENMRKRGPSDTVNEEKYSDYYRIHTPVHPFFSKLREWYSTGEKVTPEDLKIGPTAIRYWYACDGYMYFRKKKYALPRITTGSEVDKLRSLVEDNGISTHSGQSRFTIAQSNTEKFFDVIGRDPVPGYEYKWCTDFERYKRLRGEDYMGD